MLDYKSIKEYWSIIGNFCGPKATNPVAIGCKDTEIPARWANTKSIPSWFSGPKKATKAPSTCWSGNTSTVSRRWSAVSCAIRRSARMWFRTASSKPTGLCRVSAVKASSILGCTGLQSIPPRTIWPARNGAPVPMWNWRMPSSAKAAFMYRTTILRSMNFCAKSLPKWSARPWRSCRKKSGRPSPCERWKVFPMRKSPKS